MMVVDMGQGVEPFLEGSMIQNMGYSWKTCQASPSASVEHHSQGSAHSSPQDHPQKAIHLDLLCMDANIPGLISHYHEGVVDDAEVVVDHSNHRFSTLVVVRGNNGQEIDHGL